jgi:uncharacterized protein (TIGR03083 family)
VKPLRPVIVVHLFPEERAALLDVLRSLNAEQWGAPTVCEGWSVADVARHLLADDLGRLSWQRDGHSVSRFTAQDPETFEADVRDFINRQNEQWVETARRLSPQTVTDLLEWSGAQTQAHFESLDPDAPGLGVAWAGEQVSANWFDLAREYTERWHHQAQIREGAGIPLLTEQRLYTPFFETVVRGVPHTLRVMTEEEGVHVLLRIAGDAGGEWSLVRVDGLWQLVEPLNGDADATVEIEQDVAWRLFTKGLTPEQARAGARVSGNERLAEQVLRTVSIIA